MVGVSCQKVLQGVNTARMVGVIFLIDFAIGNPLFTLTNTSHPRCSCFWDNVILRRFPQLHWIVVAVVVLRRLQTPLLRTYASYSRLACGQSSGSSCWLVMSSTDLSCRSATARRSFCSSSSRCFDFGGRPAASCSCPSPNVCHHYQSEVVGPAQTSCRCGNRQYRRTLRA